MIPVRFTCDGDDISPDLRWANAPENTKSFALICEDPDAPVGTWIHWVIFNIPAEIDHLEEQIEPFEHSNNGMIHGLNDFRRLGYGGPCPPNGIHRYFFRLYALDEELDCSPRCLKADVMEAMQGHVLAQAALMGKYSRS